MDVSENRGTLKSSILIGFSIINHPFWDIPIFGNSHIFNHIYRLPMVLPHSSDWVSVCETPQCCRLGSEDFDVPADYEHKILRKWKNCLCETTSRLWLPVAAHMLMANLGKSHGSSGCAWTPTCRWREAGGVMPVQILSAVHMI